jgi:hypothetical protein
MLAKDYGGRIENDSIEDDANNAFARMVKAGIGLRK